MSPAAAYAAGFGSALVLVAVVLGVLIWRALQWRPPSMEDSVDG